MSEPDLSAPRSCTTPACAQSAPALHRRAHPAANIDNVHPLTNTFNLVARAQQGDDSAKNQLFTRYYEKVRRVVRVRIGPALRAHVETGDALQMTFLKAFQLFDKFEMREEGSFIKWLATVAEGQIKDALDNMNAQKRGADRVVPLADDGEDGNARAREPLASTRADPVANAREREEHERLERALDRLPAPARELILARDFEGFSWEQAAKETGSPSADAARMRYATALRDLAVLLAGDSAGE